MTGLPLTIRVDMTPASCLSPNRSKGRHWAVNKKPKNDLIYATKKGLSDANKYGWLDRITFTPPVTVEIQVRWEKGRKEMDGDNLLASLKACIDEVAKYINVDDKHFNFAPIEQGRDPQGRGFMFVTVEGS